MNNYKERISNFNNYFVNNNKIELDSFRKVCLGGIPELNNYRSKSWLLLLNVLTADKLCWPKTIKNNISNYESLKNELFECTNQLDVDLLNQIDVDLQRTQPEFSFFHNNTTYDSTPNKSETTLTDNKDVMVYEKYSYNEYVDSKLHLQCIRRILYIYAKINVSIGYIQGMNELVAALYYVVAKKDTVDHKYESRDNDVTDTHVEANVFYMFHNLMGYISDFYTIDLESNNRVLNEFETTLKFVDYEIYWHLKNLGVDVRYYAFKWLVLLGSQDFELPELCRLWDVVFSYVPMNNKYNNINNISPSETMIYISVAMLVVIKEQILGLDEFTDIMYLLQHYPYMHIDQICQIAIELDSLIFTSKINTLTQSRNHKKPTSYWKFAKVDNHGSRWNSLFINNRNSAFSSFDSVKHKLNNIMK